SVDTLDRRMQNPMFEVVEADIEELMHAGRLVPIHPLTRGLTARLVRRIVRESLDLAAAKVSDPVPAEIARAHDLGTLEHALHEIHFPAGEAELERARRRLAFEELFLLQTVL